MTGLYRWYLQGRDDADEDLDLEQFDAETLARRVLSGTPIRDLTVTALTDLLAIDPHDGSEREWIEEHHDDLEDDEVDPRAAYAEWRRGWIDEGAHQLETDIVEAMQELLDELDEEEDEDDDEERPAGAATYNDWYKTGVQDCGNVWNTDDWDERAFRKFRRAALKLSGQELVDAVAAFVKEQWEENREESQEHWDDQNAEEVTEDGLDPAKAYENWSNGYMECQRNYLRKWVEREKSRVGDDDL